MTRRMILGVEKPNDKERARGRRAWGCRMAGAGWVRCRAWGAGWWMARLLAACVLLLGGAPMIGGCRSKAPDVVETPLRIHTEVALSQPMATRVITAANVQVERRQPLYFQLGGTVEKVVAIAGRPVKKGQLLAKLDTEGQENQVEKNRLNLEQARISEEQTRHDLENARALLDSGGVSDEEIHDLEQQLRQKTISRKEAEINVADAELRVRQMKIIAPYDGVVAEVNIQVGDLVRGAVSDPDREVSMVAPIYILDPSSRRRVEAQLPEGRAVSVEIGTKAEIQLMEHPDIVLKGEVVGMGASVDRETRTVDVLVDVEEPPGGYPPALRDGSGAQVVFLTEYREKAVTVSEQAIHYFNDHAYVFVVKEDKTIEKRPIERGLIHSGRVEVRRGLRAGERVAASHLYLLRDGQKVLTEDTL